MVGGGAHERVRSRAGGAALCGALALALGFSALAQQPDAAQQTAQPGTSQAQSTTTGGGEQPPAAAPSPSPSAAPSQAPASDASPQPGAAAAAQSQPAAQTPASAQTAPAPAPASAATGSQPGSAPATAAPAAQEPKSATGSVPSQTGGITEAELKEMLVGKPLFLRGGYLDNTLSFNEHGALIGHSPQGSYTLCGVEIDKVRITKHKVESEGARYALHFLGALPYEDPTKAVDRVKITPKKKVLKITVDRELVAAPKKKKEKEPAKAKAKTAVAGAAAQPAAAATGRDERSRRGKGRDCRGSGGGKTGRSGQRDPDHIGGARDPDAERRARPDLRAGPGRPDDGVDAIASGSSTTRRRQPRPITGPPIPPSSVRVRWTRRPGC